MQLSLFDDNRPQILLNCVDDCLRQLDFDQAEAVMEQLREEYPAEPALPSLQLLLDEWRVWLLYPLTDWSDPALLQHPGLAVVGARSATAQGMANAEAFSLDLAARGLTIVSGLAAGIDAAAHRGALAAGPAAGRTIAGIGTGIDRIYPARNAALAREIAACGAIGSEFPLGTPPLQHNLPRRNRIIAGLAQGVLVIEAALNSGSLITARLATECGREVFAIPGSIHSPLARGCHRLIRDGAKLVETAEDIVEEIGARPGWSPPSSAAVEASRDRKSVV